MTDLMTPELNRFSCEAFVDFSASVSSSTEIALFGGSLLYWFC